MQSVSDCLRNSTLAFGKYNLFGGEIELTVGPGLNFTVGDLNENIFS